MKLCLRTTGPAGCAAPSAEPAHGHRDGEVADFQGGAGLVLQTERPRYVLVVNGEIHLEEQGGGGVIGDLINGLGKSALGVGGEGSRAGGGQAGGLNGLPRAAGEAVFDEQIAQPLADVVRLGGTGVVVAPQADDGAVVEFDVEEGIGGGGRGEKQGGQDQSEQRQFHDQDIRR